MHSIDNFLSEKYEMSINNTEIVVSNLKKPSVYILIILISFGSFGANLFTPALPVMMDFFHIEINFAQLPVILYLLGFALGQLICGPLAHSFGRKKVLFIGCALFIIGNMFSALSAQFESYSLLLISRFGAALGASPGLSLTFLMITDFYAIEKARKVTAYTFIAFAVMPGLSVAIGGFIVQYLGWEYCFYFLSLYSLLAIFLIKQIDEESLNLKKEPFCLRKIAQNYGVELKSELLLLYSSMIGSKTAIIYLFTSTAPIIAIKILGIAPKTYGILNLIPRSGYLCGILISSYLVDKISRDKLLKLGVGITLLGILFFVAVFFAKIINIVSLFLPFFIFFLGIPMFYSSVTVFATYSAQNRPVASSLMSFFDIFGAVMGLFLLGLLGDSILFTLPLSFLLISTAIVFLLFFSEKYVRLSVKS